MEQTKKNKYIKFKVTPAEQIEIRRRAKERKTPISQYIRSCINEQVVVQLPVEQQNKNLATLSAQLSAIGNNLNQIARTLNSSGEVKLEELNIAIGTISSLQDEVKTAVKNTAKLYKKAIQPKKEVL